MGHILSARRCWPIQSAALLLRADLEKSHGRRVDRSCSQTELICKLMQGIDDETSDEIRLERTDFVLASGLEPIWQANVLHTTILRSLGCTSEALLILEKLELWDNVIDCYKALGQLEKAESLVRRLIEQKPTDSMLFVYLGDITQNTEYYYTAIKLSDDRNARAHRSLGHLLLMRKNYEEAYKHLRRSLELQPIQLGTWFNAGYCAWKLENYKDSTHCYHRCVSFQPDHFEAWNNLSAAYIRCGQKEKAWKLLQEALKFNYEHANVWENFMLLSVDIGNFQQAIISYHRLLDLNKRGADDEVLELLASQVLKREKQLVNDDEIAENVKDKEDLVKLFARISAQHQTLSPKTLRLWAQLKKPRGKLTNETRTEFEKYLQLMEKSFGQANGKQNWSKDESAIINILETAIRLGEDRIELAKFINSPTSVNEASARIRLSLRGVLTRIEKDENSRIPGEKTHARLEFLVSEAKKLLQNVN
ncbi:unnamed protein product [Caenorhabditis angaria]|uniref:Tetratricopeptide repeat protein 27 n=1 Tax=Caenorhabditis angaria TaxID=860376 RepID=A0A9P1IK89_9PELO|nr:unnamed protein product [Caenorhabditis angaria]